MPKLNTKITIELIWLKEKTDLSKCSGCGDVIYGEMNVLLLSPKTDNVSLRGTMADLALCDSCRDLVEFNK